MSREQHPQKMKSSISNQFACARSSRRSATSRSNSLLPWLRRLDRLLETAIDAAQTAFNQVAPGDPFRGLYINQDELTRLLGQEPGAPLLWTEQNNSEDSRSLVEPEASPIARLKQAFELSSLDIDVIILTLAPELDLRYERLYAFLQDDVSKRRPSIDLALNLLCSDAESKLLGRTHFAADSPLMYHRIIHLHSHSQQQQHGTPLLAFSMKLDEQIINLLLSHDHMDSRLASFCQVVDPDSTPDIASSNKELREAFSAVMTSGNRRRRKVSLYFQGANGIGKRQGAETIACLAQKRLLVANMSLLAKKGMAFQEALPILFREAWLRDAILYICQADLLEDEDKVFIHEMLDTDCTVAPFLTIVAGSNTWRARNQIPVGMLTIPFSMPDAAARRILWKRSLDDTGLSLKSEDLDALVDRYRLTPFQIKETILQTANKTFLLTEEPSGEHYQNAMTACLSAARSQCGHELSELAGKINPHYSWNDIVLPPDGFAQLYEICKRVACQEQVLGKWGFGEKLSRGKGVSVLFAGSSGTGKTMAAEVIANELKLDLYKIDLSQVVSKYIGETEKNLERIFRAAENSNAILFFDEADALFGKRSEVKDAHDRYANVEIAYLLQKMEDYQGLIILASNLRQNMDESFVRRISFTVHFNFPDEASRHRIWCGIWPKKTPLADDVDFGYLARAFKLSGGNIKNIALAAAFLAADEEFISMEHILRSVTREYQKMGKVLTETEVQNARAASGRGARA